MTKTTHRISGWLMASVASAMLSPALPSPFLLAMAIGIILGATAPDWMEIPLWVEGTRLSLVPHRTITHWIALWVIFLAVALFETVRNHNAATCGLCGFAAGALLHCVLDATTPMGVPVLNPFERKRIFRGQHGTRI